MSGPGAAARAGVLAAAFLYTAAFLLWYGGTPLGRVPLLDGAEVVALARDIAGATLPHEPFYRAPLYAALLALALKLGVSPAALPDLARAINGATHLAAAWCVTSIAWRLWQRRAAAVAAGLLYGLYPVALHFAGDVGDTSLGIALFLAGVVRAIDVAEGATRPRAAAAAASLLALATLARPQFLPVLLAFLGWLGWRAVRARSTMRDAVAAGACAIALLGAMGLANWRVSGDFTVLPWQGAFNLWKANSPASNGRYFEQETRLDIPPDAVVNPARVEGTALYRAAIGPDAPWDLHAESRYWRARFVEHVLAHPAQWLGLMGAKLLYLADNAEQYNNKTYAVHKRLSPWLAPNPLCWSLLLTLGLVALAALRRGPATRVVVATLLVYLAGVMIYYVSDRFRLPAAPLLAALAGGVFAQPVAELAARARERLPLVLAAAAVGLASFVPIPEQSRPTETEDYGLLANAALRTGRSAEAVYWSEQALARHGDDAKALDWLCLSRHNLLQDEPARFDRARLADALRGCELVAREHDIDAYVAGVFAWRLGDAERARGLWQGLIDRRSPESARAAGALVLTNRMPAADFDALPAASVPPPLLVALAARGAPRWRAELVARQGERLAAFSLERAERLFAPP